MSENRTINKDSVRCFDDTIIPYIIDCAKSGCIKSARTLAELTASYLSDDIEFPLSLKTFLKEAFQSISEGQSADKALYLSHKKGKRDTGLYRKQAIANEVRRLYWTGEAETIEAACEYVSLHGVEKIVADGTETRVYVDAKTAHKYYYEIWPGKPERHP